MRRVIEINGRTYKIPEMDFNAVCELAECGIDIMNPKSLSKSPIIAARAITAWIMDTDKQTAGNEIQAHIINGGELSEIFEAFSAEVQDSDFFKALSGTAESKVTPQDHKKKGTTKQSST